ncbi:LysR family transcriptional regulator [Pseudoclavibacter terrae]|uniref:LysR family transcriptional regulator n=1 Tax=Pseudoclavibacter terrae TaxID=1530195 RepID=A0A7J5B435_9MICO|nr:LysR family transcriptional regulator [Pseudoclavibacter terrae]KAB1638355.1 LysR family transcriptional regulator [Pseudoclavibacter terrae]
MDTALLKTFLAVASRGSLTAAAEELHLAQSTVTVRLQALERELDVRLFDRRRDGVRITEAAIRVRERAQDLLDMEESLFSAARLDASVVQGDVVVGAPESICAFRLPTILAKLRHEYSLLRVHLVPAGTKDVSRGVLERRFDIGLVLDERLPPSRLSASMLTRERIAVYVASDHEIARRPPSVLGDIAQESLFLLEGGCSYADRFLRDLSVSTPSAPSVTRFGSIEAVRACVEAGLGLGVLPEMAARAAEHQGKIVRVPTLPRPDVPLQVVTDSRRSSSPAVDAVVGVLSPGLMAAD